MYKNKIIYDKKWEIPSNIEALSTLQSKYFHYADCSSHCPAAWAPEVLELLNLLKKELGILRNENTLSGYYIQGDLVNWFITNPIKNFISSIVLNIFGKPTKYDRHLGENVIPSFSDRLRRILDSTLHPIKYGFKASKVRYINRILNKFSRAKISLGQIKEKYGHLTIYYDAPETDKQFIEDEINKTIARLTQKGAY